MVLSYFIFILVLLCTLLLIKKWSFLDIPGLSKKWLYLGFSIKLFMGFAIWFIYTYYYTDRATADIYKYFDDAQVIFKATQNELLLRLQFLTGVIFDEESYIQIVKNTQHWDRNTNEAFNDNRSIIRINLLILSISNGLFHLHTLVFSVLSFLGSIALLKFFKKYSSISTKILFLILFFVPSIVFWNSGVLKEAWLFFCLGFSLLSFHNLMLKQSFYNLIQFFVFGFGLYFIKPYILICLVPGLLFIRLDYLFNWKRKILSFGLTFIGIIALAFGNYAEKFFEIINSKRSDFIELAKSTNANSLISDTTYDSILEMLFHTPTAIFTSIFRPGIWEISGLFSLISAVENTVLLLLLVLPVRYFKKLNDKDLNILLFSISFVILLGTLIGLSTPILGAIVRYKIPLLPFYLIAILSFTDLKRIPFIQKLL